MPSSTASLALTDAYRDRLLALRQRTAVLAAQGWRNLDPANLYDSYAAWLATTTATVEGAKRQGVGLTDAYLAAYLGAELATEVRPRGLDPEPYLEAIGARPLVRALYTPLLTVRVALNQGRPTEEALRLGLARATRIAAVEVLDAPRRALGDLMREEDRIAGWRRVTSRNACGACLALADGAVHDPGAVLETHGHCRCTAEPVVRGVRERTRRPTGREHFDALSPAEQATLFHGRGGEEKAELIRAGAVPFDALIQRERMETTPDEFTETPLGRLRELATGESATPSP